MNEFFTMLMDGLHGEPIRITIRNDRIESVQRNGKTLTILLIGREQPITLNLNDYTESKKVYDQVAQQLHVASHD